MTPQTKIPQEANRTLMTKMWSTMSPNHVCNVNDDNDDFQPVFKQAERNIFTTPNVAD